jgi:2-methylcitrate dehydratase
MTTISEIMPHEQEIETHTAVQRIATFAAAARPAQLTPDLRQLYKRNILDSIGCAIAAQEGRPFRALRERLFT